MKQYSICSSTLPDHLSPEMSFWLEITSEKDIQPEDPLLPRDQPVVQGVKVLEDPVHQDVVRHLEDVVEELPEGVPVHPVNLLGVLSVQLKQHLNHRQIQIQSKRNLQQKLKLWQDLDLLE